MLRIAAGGGYDEVELLSFRTMSIFERSEWKAK
jgi:hypothetical protein